MVPGEDFPKKTKPLTGLDPFLRRCRWRTCFQRKGSPESSCWPLRRCKRDDFSDDRHGKQRALGMMKRDDSFFLGEESRNQDIDLGFGRQCHCDHFEWMVSDPNVQNRWVAGLKF